MSDQILQAENLMRAEHEFSDDERRLYDLMSEISEDCYFAGWMAGNEHALWDAITTGDLRYGQGDMDRELLAQVAALSVKTGRWIIWRDDHDGLDPHDISEWGPYSITIADWLARRSTTSIQQGDETGATTAKNAAVRFDSAAQGDELPPLPSPAHFDHVLAAKTGTGSAYTAHQLREYGAACRAGSAADARDALIEIAVMDDAPSMRDRASKALEAIDAARSQPGGKE